MFSHKKVALDQIIDCIFSNRANGLEWMKAALLKKLRRVLMCYVIMGTTTQYLFCQ